ncbi:MAG: hypothetical protein ACX94D_09665 [Henriciella sp.]|jgi:hypothetical protein
MSIRKLLLAGTTLMASAAIATPANASIIDRPHFKVLGVVIVWAADDSNGGTPIATDFVIDSDDGGNNDADLIGGSNVDGRTVVTGSLTATPDASSTAGLGSILDIEAGGTTIATANTNTGANFSAFDVTGASLTSDDLTYESSFYVASNTPFAIDAFADPAALEESGDFEADDIGYSLDVTVSGNDGIAFGGNAQSPGNGFNAPATLDLLTTQTQVFNGTARTAANPGSIVSQSVRFDATYTLGAGTAYDLSQGAGEVKADVVYTVYVP